MLVYLLLCLVLQKHTRKAATTTVSLSCPQAQEGRLSEYEAATIMRCVLEFLVDCHKRSICYGDIKPNNFVLRSLSASISHLLDPRQAQRWGCNKLQVWAPPGRRCHTCFIS